STKKPAVCRDMTCESNAQFIQAISSPHAVNGEPDRAYGHLVRRCAICRKGCPRISEERTNSITRRSDIESCRSIGGVADEFGSGARRTVGRAAQRLICIYADKARN